MRIIKSSRYSVVGRNDDTLRHTCHHPDFGNADLRFAISLHAFGVCRRHLILSINGQARSSSALLTDSVDLVPMA